MSLDTKTKNNFSIWTLFVQTMKIKKDEFYYSPRVRTNSKNTIFIIIFIIFAFLLSFGFASATGGYNFNFLFTSMFSTLSVFYKEWLVFASILGIAGLSFLFAYKSGLFNIGISGQMLGAGLALVGLSKSLKLVIESNPSEAWILLSILIVSLTGAFIALITGLLKIFFNINEVVSSIMLNWIVFYLARFFIVGTKGSGAGDLAGDNGNSMMIEHDLSLFNTTQSSGFIGAIIIFIVLSLLIWIVFRFTTYGKKIMSIGKSNGASLYSGYYTKTLKLSSFVVSGAIAGILALVVYTAQSSTTGITSDIINGTTLPTEGFNGIVISLVAFSNSILIIPISLLFSMVQTSIDFPTGLSSLVLSLTMYGVAIFVIIHKIKPIEFIKRKLSKKEKYDDSYYVHLHKEKTNQFLKCIRNELSNRKINIFLSNKKVTKKSFINKMKSYISNMIECNQRYIDDSKIIKANYTPWYKALKKKIVKQ